MRASNWLDIEGAREVEGAIERAETETRCEFVCAVATRSAAYSKTGYIWSLLGAVSGFLLASSLSHGTQQAGSWDHLHNIPLTESLIGVVLGFLVATALALRHPWVRPPFVSKATQAEAVQRAAAFLFGKHRVSHTEERVGVLLYLSLAERKFVVLADKAARAALGDEGLAELTKVATQELAQKKRGSAFVKALEVAAQRLKQTFPYQEGDQDELSNQILLIHPHP